MAKKLTPEDILTATHTVNEEVLDRAIRHSHHIQRLKTHEVNEIVGFLNREVLPDTLVHLRKRLDNITMRGFDTGPRTSERLREIIGSTNKIMQAGIHEAGTTLRKDLQAFALTEAEWQAATLARSTGALDIAFNTPSVGQLNSILTSRPYQGHVFNEWWGKVSVSSQNIIRSQVSIGIAEGETTDQIIRRLRGTTAARFADGGFEKVRHNVAATVRTSVTHVNAHAREMTYAENDDVIKGTQYVATLDGRTTDICMSLDGKVFDVDDGPRPPQHYGCRSTTVPVLKSFEEMGLPAMRRALPERTRATKDIRGHMNKAMNGQVPDRVTYGKWLRKQSKAVQNDTLGPARAKLFRSGKIAIDRFVDNRNRTLTLDQLREREELPIRRGARRAVPIGKLKTPEDFISAETKELNKMGIPVPEMRIGHQSGVVSKNAVASYQAFSKTVTFDNRGDYWSNARVFAKQYNKEGYWSSPNQLHPIRHEVGHAQHHANIGKRYVNLKKERFTTAERSMVKRDVSRYASFSNQEFVAEVFAGMMDGKRYSRDIMGLYSRFGGPAL